MHDALRRVIPTHRGCCSWTVDHAGWIVTLHSAEEQDPLSQQIAKGRHAPLHHRWPSGHAGGGRFFRPRFNPTACFKATARLRQGLSLVSARAELRISDIQPTGVFVPVDFPTTTRGA